MHPYISAIILYGELSQYYGLHLVFLIYDLHIKTKYKLVFYYK